MTVTNIEGPRGSLPHLIPTAWRRDEGTLCVLLDNPKSGHWLILTIDLCNEAEVGQAKNEREMI